jgi:hypothetical protein
MSARECHACRELRTTARQFIQSSGPCDPSQVSIFTLARATPVDIDKIVSFAEQGGNLDAVDENEMSVLSILVRRRNQWYTLMDLLDTLIIRQLPINVDRLEPYIPGREDKVTLLHVMALRLPGPTQRDKKEYIDWIRVVCKLSKQVGLAGEYKQTPMHYAVDNNNPTALYALARYNTYEMENVDDTHLGLYTPGRSPYELIQSNVRLGKLFQPLGNVLDRALTDGIQDKLDTVSRQT